jgi:pyruvate/2-oxoglutarate dehydrogenase complex dihydrolipoamide acyltransferase (E2) component
MAVVTGTHSSLRSGLGASPPSHLGALASVPSGDRHGLWQIRVVTLQGRGVDVRPFPARRRLVTGAMRAGRRMTPMHGLIEVDVTDASRLLAEHGPGLSFTAFVVASVARAAAAHPHVHAYRNWRGQVVTHRHVDVNTIVEIVTPQGPFPLAHVIRDADRRDVADLTGELRRVKAASSRRPAGGWSTVAAVGIRVPGVIRVMYAVMGKSVRARQRVGTVAVTAVGMFAAGGGYGITQPALMSLQIVVGGISDRARVLDGEVKVRQVLDLTVTIDHDVVDGGPAARFGADLRRLIEDATVLRGTADPLATVGTVPEAASENAPDR